MVTDVDCKWFSALCERLWPDKAGAALDYLTSAELHQCYRYASGRQQPPGIVIVDLLLSADGPRFLTAVLAKSQSPLAREWLLGRKALADITALVDGWKQREMEFE